MGVREISVISETAKSVIPEKSMISDVVVLITIVSIQTSFILNGRLVD